MDDPHDLQRFVAAQEPVMDAVEAELRAGRKRSHWMWYVFPQLRGLGRSPTAKRYGISGADEARAYLADPVLGPRLVGCCRQLLALEGNDPEAVFGSTDALKLRSSMTLFAHVAAGEGVFRAVLEKYFDGAEDALTIALLGRPGG